MAEAQVDSGTKKLSWKIIIACLAFSPLLNTAGLLAPVLGTMQQWFAEQGYVYPDWLVQNISTSLMLSTFIMGLIFGLLNRKISLRNMGIAGIIITTVCMVLPGLFPQGGLWFFIACRFLSGFGIGLCYSCATSCIVMHFPAEKRGKYIAINVALMQLFSIIYSFIAGRMGVINWRFNFLFCFVFVIPLIIVILWLPKDKPLGQQVTESGEKIKIKLSGQTWFAIILGAVVFLVSTFFMFGISQEIMAAEIGTAIQAGNILSLGSLCGFLASLVWDKVHKVVGRGGILVVCLLGAVTYFLAGSVVTMPALYIAGVIYGVLGAAALVEFNTTITEAAGVTATPTAIGFFNGLVRLTGFFMPTAVAAMTGLCGFAGPGGAMMGTLPFWAIAIVLSVIYLIMYRGKKTAE